MVCSCGKHQYIAIPSANAQDNFSSNIDQRPAHVVPAPGLNVTGAPNLVAGQSVTVDINFSAAVTMSVTQLTFIVLDPDGRFYPGYWDLDLTDAELAAGTATVELFALAEEPKNEWCQKDSRGTGTCYQEADQGVTGIGVMPSNADSLGFPGSTIPVTLAALGGSSDACSSFTQNDCCAGSPGIKAVSCNVDPSCLCPGALQQNGYAGDGTRICVCP